MPDLEAEQRRITLCVLGWSAAVCCAAAVLAYWLDLAALAGLVGIVGMVFALFFLWALLGGPV